MTKIELSEKRIDLRREKSGNKSFAIARSKVQNGTERGYMGTEHTKNVRNAKSIDITRNFPPQRRSFPSSSPPLLRSPSAS